MAPVATSASATYFFMESSQNDPLCYRTRSLSHGAKSTHPARRNNRLGGNALGAARGRQGRADAADRRAARPLRVDREGYLGLCRGGLSGSEEQRAPAAGVEDGRLPGA